MKGNMHSPWPRLSGFPALRPDPCRRASSAFAVAWTWTSSRAILQSVRIWKLSFGVLFQCWAISEHKTLSSAGFLLQRSRSHKSNMCLYYSFSTGRSVILDFSGGQGYFALTHSTHGSCVSAANHFVGTWRLFGSIGILTAEMIILMEIPQNIREQLFVYRRRDGPLCLLDSWLRHAVGNTKNL